MLNQLKENIDRQLNDTRKTIYAQRDNRHSGAEKIQ